MRPPNNYKENQYENINMPLKKGLRPFNFKGNRVITHPCQKNIPKKSLNLIYFCFIFKNNQII